MGRYVVVHPVFEEVWPEAAEYLREIWAEEGEVAFVRVEREERPRLGEALDDPADVTRLISLGLPVTEDCIEALSNLEEAAVVTDTMYAVDDEVHEELNDRGVETYGLRSEGFWSESVAELGIGLTIAALRRIPQKHHAVTESHDAWDRDLWEGSIPGAGGYQGVADEPFHTHGTVAGKRVRAVGVGNIGSRYVDLVDAMGADVAAYDPYADEPCFHRTGARQVHHLDELVADAEIFAPMVPLTEDTEGLIDADLVDSLPEGCLVVLITRAGVCDMEAVRERVFADELALAADVFDVEPLPLDDPLLGRENVVHTPHVAGRTSHANREFARHLVAQFRT